jgi:hypothetical protein
MQTRFGPLSVAIPNPANGVNAQQGLCHNLPTSDHPTSARPIWDHHAN